MEPFSKIIFAGVRQRCGVFFFQEKIGAMDGWDFREIFCFFFSVSGKKKTKKFFLKFFTQWK